MNTIEQWSDDELRRMAENAHCVHETHTQVRKAREEFFADKENDAQRFLPVTWNVVANECEQAVTAWIEGGRCCEDNSIPHNLMTFGVLFGQVMYQAGRNSVTSGIVADDWIPEPVEHLTDEEYTEWIAGVREASERSAPTAEQIEEIREKLQDLVQAMGLDDSVVKVMGIPAGFLPEQESADSDISGTGFGQYL